MTPGKTDLIRTGIIAAGAAFLLSACSGQGQAETSQGQQTAPSRAPAASAPRPTPEGPAGTPAFDCAAPASLCGEAGAGHFALIADGTPAAVLSDEAHLPGVARAVANLRGDLSAVAGADAGGSGPRAVIAGTLGQGGLVDALVADGKLDIAAIEGEWEAFTWQTVSAPVGGVDQALVIAGSDMRGTIYGIYDLSEKVGVSPWHWWADVPIRQASDIHVTPGGRHDMPAVRYRGIFLNDEEPALGNWVRENYGDFNAQFYERVFDLILRLKGNYLWPAMWGKAFYDDDPDNAPLADEMGIVIGTSHHEPLARAHVEWERYGEGDWNYATNAGTLRDFWREGMARRGDHEAIITIGMRGDGDEAMTEGTAIELLETIVADQREIIADVTGRPAAETPQIWALYKEVQDYYDQGMDVPDDVTLLFADDNWGNIRRLPEPGSERPGGYGVYYHFDYVGGPRNYKWINKTQISRIWEQMHLAHEYGANEIWIVNVGDLKPMELPIDFFLDYAWDPVDWPLERLPDYTREWAAEQFGPDHAEEIAALLTGYTQYNSRRTAEMLDAGTYSLVNGEWDSVTEDYMALADRAESLLDEIDPAYRDAYMQLVWHPVVASANLYKLYLAAARNALYAEQGRVSANDHADAVADYFARDEDITRIFHEDIAGGKWNHMMSQTHIGYTYWQQPDKQTPPATRTVEPVDGVAIGVAVEGSREAWPGSTAAPALPTLTPYGQGEATITVFNRGDIPVRFKITDAQDWLTLSTVGGEVTEDMDVTVSADWEAVPAGTHQVPVTITGGGETIVVMAPVFKPEMMPPADHYVAANGVVSMPATGATRQVQSGGISWSAVPELGLRGKAITMFPVTAGDATPGSDAPRLEYDIYLFEGGDLSVDVTTAPSLDFTGSDGLRYAVSVDDGEPQIVNMNEESEGQNWYRWVGENSITRTVDLGAVDPGAHTVKVWMVDPGVVFYRVTAATGDVPDLYLGPQASMLAQ